MISPIKTGAKIQNQKIKHFVQISSYIRLNICLYVIFQATALQTGFSNKISFPIYVNFIRNVYALKPLILKYEHIKLLNKNQFIPIIELAWYYASFDFRSATIFPHPSLKNCICKTTLWLGVGFSHLINQTNTRCVYFQLWLVEITVKWKENYFYWSSGGFLLGGWDFLFVWKLNFY